MPLLKPLYSNLLRVDFGQYLISNSFSHLSIELNMDELWKDYIRYVVNQSSGLIIVPGFTGYAEDALGLLLNTIYNKGREVFIEILSKIIVDFIHWSKEEKDLTLIKKSLLDLGFKEEELEFLSYTSEKVISKAEQRKVEKTAMISIDDKLCFVLMPFNENFDAIYKDVIKKTANEVHLNCKRANEIFGTRPIMDDIIEYIKKARFLIADLTDRNANVFYELGLAHALYKKVILITQKIEDAPFDLKHYRCVVYKNSIVGASDLGEGLKATIEQTLEETFKK